MNLNSTDRAFHHRVIMGTAANLGGRAIVLATWFLLTPFLLYQLGATHYALWVLVGSFVSYGSLLDLGIGGALIKYIAEYRSRGELVAMRELVATSLCLYLGLGLAAILIGVAVAPLFPTLFHVAPDEQQLATMLVIVMAINVGVAIPSTATSAVLIGLQRYDLANLMGLIGTLSSALLTVIVLLLGGGVVGMVAVNIPITLLLQIPSIIVIRRIAPDLRFGLRGARRDRVRQVFSFSTSLFIGDIAGRLQLKTDEIVISAMLAIAAVTPYALARKLSEAASLVTGQFLKVLLPLASELHAVNDRVRLRALYLTSTRLTLAIFLPVACVLVIIPDIVLRTWVGPAYASSAPLVIILTLSGLVNISQSPAGSLLKGMGRPQLLAFAALGNGIANLGLSIALARPLGVTGVALGTLLPTAVECLGVVLPYAVRAVGVSFSEVLEQVVLPAFLPVVPAALALLVMRSTLPIATVAALIVVSGTTVLIYGGGYMVLATGAERTLVLDLLRRVACHFGLVTIGKAK